MKVSREDAGEQLFPYGIMWLIMDALAPEEACRMSLTSKSLRQNYTFKFSNHKANLKRAIKLMNEVNAALISKTWRWKIAVRLQPGKNSLRQGLKKPNSPLTPRAAAKGTYRYHLMVKEIQCVTKSRSSTHSHNHTHI